MKCAEIREMLPAHTDDPDLGLVVRRHLARCQDCKQELALYEELDRSLGAMIEATVEPPAGLLASLEAISSQASKTTRVLGHVERNRKVYVGAGVALAGAAGAALWRNRARRVATA